MEMRSNVKECPDVLAEEWASHELIRRFLKLRWMGMEDEADQMRSALQRAAAQVTLLAGPCDTD